MTRRRDPARPTRPPESGVRLIGQKGAARYRVQHYEGIDYYPFAIEFTTDDGQKRHQVLYSPGTPWVRETITRYFDGEGVVIMPGSDVRGRWLITPEEE